MRQISYKYIIENEKPIFAYQYLDGTYPIELLYVDEEIVENYSNRIWEILITRFNAYFEYRDEDEDNIKWFVIVFNTIEEAEDAVEYFNSLAIINKLTE
jgi:hypothetical protein